MLKEIKEIPGVLSCLFDDFREVCSLANLIKKTSPNIIYLAGRGSSYHAALVGKYIIETFINIPVCILAPSVFTRYNGTLPFRKSLTIAISQSGVSSELSELLNMVTKEGGKTVAITNYPGSHLANVAHYILPMKAGKEEAVPATKSYAASIALFFLLIDELTGKLHFKKENVPIKIEQLLKEESFYYEAAGMIKSAACGFIIGRGINFPTALETALKFQECGRILACGVGAVDFFHGPIASVRENIPVIVIPTLQKNRFLKNLTEKVKEKGGRFITLPHIHIKEELSPLVYAVEGQLLAYHVALLKGENPDSPQGLSKITQVNCS